MFERKNPRYGVGLEEEKSDEMIRLDKEKMR
jgi:hypothetical protein